MSYISLSPHAEQLAAGVPTIALMRQLRRIVDQSPQQAEAFQARFADGFGSSADGKKQAAALAYILDQPADALSALGGAKDAWGSSLEGIIMSELEEYEDAKKALQSADEPAAKIEMVRVLIAMDDLDGAEAAVDNIPDGPWNEFAYGLVEEARGHTERAIGCLEAAVEGDSTLVDAAFKLGVLLDRIGDDDMAIENYLLCADADPAYLPGVINLGILFEERGDANAAIDCFRQVLAHNPSNNRAKLLMRDASASRSMFYDEKEEREAERRRKIFSTSVNDFELSVRSRNCLAKMDIFTLGDLVSITEQEMLNYKNFGDTSLKEVKDMLNARGMRLGMLREHEDRVPTRADQKSLAESVDKLELGPDAATVAQNLKASKVGDLAKLSDMDLYLAPGSGQTVVQEIATALGAHGLNLKRPPII